MDVANKLPCSLNTCFRALTMSDEHLTRPPEYPAKISFLPFRFGTFGLIQALDDGRLLPFFHIALAPERVGFASRFDGKVIRPGSGETKIPLDEIVQDVRQLR
jgi:hypothetical protein